jgi:hypothetical protein
LGIDGNYSITKKQLSGLKRRRLGCDVDHFIGQKERVARRFIVVSFIMDNAGPV